MCKKLCIIKVQNYLYLSNQKNLIKSLLFLFSDLLTTLQCSDQYKMKVTGSTSAALGKKSTYSKLQFIRHNVFHIQTKGELTTNI